jgi:polyhydroxyalkanoate synthesis regulator phasin
MRKTIAAATVAASITMGGLAGAVLGAPALAGAADSTAGAVGWVHDTLSGLVSDGTLTQDQANAVESALQQARPERGPHHGGFGRMGRFAGLSAAAQALGISEDELATQLRSGSTVAEVATARDVELQSVIDAVVAAEKERLTEAVTDGDLTQAEADQRSADLVQRVTDFVNGEGPGPLPGFGRGHGFRGHHDEPEDDTTDPGSTTPGTRGSETTES